MDLVILVGQEGMETHETCEEEEGANVPKHPVVGVGKDASTSIESISIEVSLRLSTTYRVYSHSMHQMLVYDKGVTCISSRII